METIIQKRIGCYAIIIEDNKMALVKKAGGGYKGKYDLPGGGMDHGEIPSETLKRECMEETGCEVESEELFDVHAVNIIWQMKENLIEDLHHIGILFKVKLKQSNLKEDADGLDSLGARWMDIKDLTKETTSPFVWYALEKLGYK